MNWLNRLKQKPRHVRDNYAFMAAGAVVMMVAGVWSLSLPVRFAGVFANLDQNGQAASALQGVGEPIADIPVTSKDFLQSLNDVSSSLETSNSTSTESLSNSETEFAGYEDYQGDYTLDKRATSTEETSQSSVNTKKATSSIEAAAKPATVKREVRIATSTSQ